MTDLLYSSARGGVANTTKGERTRAQILYAALDLFKDRGYEKTTMRAVAEAAGVSLGNAYYYFKSKEHLIQAFYAHTHHEHLAACTEGLAEETKLQARLRLVLETKIETSMPYQQFAGVLFRSAADPQSPLNPFSEASRPLRLEATELFAQVVTGSKARIPPSLSEELPHLLWLYQMGILLFWIHDSSAEGQRTYRLINHTVDMVTRLISLASLPPFRPLTRSLLKLLADLREPDRPSND